MSEMYLMGSDGPKPIIPPLERTLQISEQQTAELLALLRQIATDMAALRVLAEKSEKYGLPVFTLP